MNPLQSHIKNYFKANRKLDKEELVYAIKKDFPEWSDNTINTYISRLKNDGLISNPARGLYELETAPHFNPKLSSQLKKLHKNISSEFPFIKFCVWDTSWLNDFMRHQPFKNFTVIEVEKDAAESVFGFVSETYKTVFINPDEEMFDRYIANLDKVVIIKNLVSEAPLSEIGKITIPSLEKLLVDMLIDQELFSAQQGEINFIMKSAMKKYSINELKMKRYAVRRNREEKLDELINTTLA